MLNRKWAGAPCAICSKAIDADVGPQLFLAESRELICCECGDAEAPELAALLRLAESAQSYIAVILESADRFTPEDLE
jgi:hypothetical protein